MDRSKKRGTGDGPVDASFNCIKALSSHSRACSCKSGTPVTEGTERRPRFLYLEKTPDRHRAVSGYDTVVASVRA